MNGIGGIDKEGSMDWLTENWVWVLVGAAFIGVHFFGHGGHGGHGGQREDGSSAKRKDDGSSAKPDEGSRGTHRH